MHICFVDVILLCSGHQHVLDTCGPLKGGKNNNKNIIQGGEHKNT